MSGCTLSFDNAVYEVSPEQDAEYKVYGNKYGFVLDGEYLAENAVISVKDEGIAKIENGIIKGITDGETQITAEIGGRTVSAQIKVSGFTVKDSTGVFVWNYGQNVSVEKKDKTYTNTSMINGTPQNPITLSGYEIYTNGNFVEIDGVVDLKEGLKLLEFAGTVINEEGNTTTNITNFYVIRVTDAAAPEKVIEFTYYADPNMSPDTPYVIFYCAKYKDELMIDYIPMYGYQLGNTNSPAYNIPKLVYFGNYSFGYHESAVESAALAAALSADNFGQNGVKISFNTGNTGMMVTSFASAAVIDGTGMFEYSNGIANVEEATIESGEGNGVSGYKITGSNGAIITFTQSISLGERWSDNPSDAESEEVVFSVLTPSALNQVIIRFTDVYDRSKGVAVSMVNAACTDVGWGETAATYIKTGGAADEFSGAFYEEPMSPVENPLGRLGSGEAVIMLRFDPSSNAFYLKLNDPTLYPLEGNIPEIPFSAENVNREVEVSVEFVGNTSQASIFVTEIGGSLG